MLLGRNNDRSPSGSLQVANDVTKIISSNTKIFEVWFDNWLISHVPNLMNQPKWYKNDTHLKEGDLILFLKNDSILTKRYQFGLVKEIYPEKDGFIRKAKITYQNHDENIKRETYRAVREIVVIHHVDEF